MRHPSETEGKTNRAREKIVRSLFARKKTGRISVYPIVRSWTAVAEGIVVRRVKEGRQEKRKEQAGNSSGKMLKEREGKSILKRYSEQTH